MSNTKKGSNLILLIAPEPFYEDRGTPIAVKHVIEALLESGSKVDLLTYPIGKAIELPGLRTFRIRNLFNFRRVPIGFSLRKLLMDIFLIPGIWKRLSRESYSCIHAVEEAAFPAVLAGRLSKIPIIYDMQSSLPEQLKNNPIFGGSVVQKGFRFFERWLIRRVDFVACSAGLKQYVRKVDPSTRVMEWHFPGQQVEVAAKEVKQLRENINLADDAPVVLYTGTFEPYQELHKLIEAALEVLSCIPNTVFVLVGGNGSDEPALLNGAKTLLKKGALKLIPRLPRSEISKFLAMANVVVSPRGYSDNLPLKIFDYLAAGKPIVAIDSPTNRRVLDDDRAVLVNSLTNEFGDAITQLLKDPDRAERLGTAARVYAKEHLEWKAFVELVAQVQTRANGQGRRARGQAVVLKISDRNPS